jgi:hypothetical protein
MHGTMNLKFRRITVEEVAGRMDVCWFCLFPD